MRIASRVILLKDNNILFIRRIKFGKDYYVLPGGGIEDGESPEVAAIRELKEETSFDITIKSLLWIIEEDVGGELRKGYYFLAKEFLGELKLGGPEATRQSEDNKYIFEWVAINTLDKILIYPEVLTEKILQQFSK
jgi:8-oxo-dGTP pyrophosphatase MutT (NUDIX family)